MFYTCKQRDCLLWKDGMVIDVDVVFVGKILARKVLFFLKISSIVKRTAITCIDKYCLYMYCNTCTCNIFMLKSGKGN